MADASPVVLNLIKAHERVSISALAIRKALADAAPEINSYGMARLQFSSALREYLMLENATLIVPLMEIRTTEAQELVAVFSREIADLRLAYSQHVADWSSSRIEREWPAYRVKTLKMLDELSRIIQLKNTSLFARAQRILDERARAA